MRTYLVYGTFGWLVVTGLLHFIVDVAAQHLAARGAPGLATSLYYGLNTSFALGQILCGCFACGWPGGSLASWESAWSRPLPRRRRGLAGDHLRVHGVLGAEAQRRGLRGALDRVRADVLTRGPRPRRPRRKRATPQSLARPCLGGPDQALILPLLARGTRACWRSSEAGDRLHMREPCGGASRHPAAAHASP